MKKKPPLKATADKADDAFIAATALSKANAGQYKEAIELYKQLLKSAENKEWRQALAQCYLQRALSLAGKGMVKEAVVLWENYAQNARPPHQSHDCYIGWLLQINAMTKVKTSLGTLSAQQLDEHYPDLAVLLGLLILTQNPELETVLPKDSAFITHLGLIRTALAAYQNNKTDDMEQALKQLPFRSPFRDVRTLLKAVLLLPESADQARSLLTKIPSTSPYHLPGQVLLTAMLDGSALVHGMMPFEHKQRQIIGTIKQFTKKQIELLEQLVKQKDRLSNKIKFNYAIQFRELFGPDLAKAYCSAALIEYPAGQHDFDKHFGKLGKFEQSQIQALGFDDQKDFNSAAYYWKKCINILEEQGAPANYKIALILRHIALHKFTQKEKVDCLIESLNYDPNDRESFLKIIDYYGHHLPKQADMYNQWLDKAFKAFPADIDFLIMAIKASMAKKAFKKAAQYAQTILKTDPVNTYAKEVLFACHLAHARKLIKTKKYHLVENEIQQAEKLNVNKRFQAQAQLVRGFYMLVAEDKKQGAQQIAEAAQKMNDGDVCAHFCIIMESLLLDLSLPQILKQLPTPAKKYQMPEQEMLRLISLIRQYHGDDMSNQALLHEALEKISAFITRVIKEKTYSEETLLSLCQCLDSINYFEPLSFCAKIALTQWKKPIWTFYKIYGDAEGQASQCSSVDIGLLQQNFYKAKEQSDERTVMLIKRFINQFYKAQNGVGFGLDDDYDDYDDYDDDDDDDDIFNPIGFSSLELFSHLPHDLFEQINIRLVTNLTRNLPGTPQLTKILVKLLPSNIDPTLIFENHDAFLGVMMIHAANELGIETEVTVKDILKYCRITPN